MSRILAFTSGPQDWQALLADPVKHWRSGYSARTLAHCWEASDGFPAEVGAPFAQSAEPLLADLTPLLAIPEFKVPLPGGQRASQNDLFVLARSVAGPVTIMVEGKVSESFGPTLEEWRREASAGKEERLRFVLRVARPWHRPRRHGPLSALASCGIGHHHRRTVPRGRRGASGSFVQRSARRLAGVSSVHPSVRGRCGGRHHPASRRGFEYSALWRVGRRQSFILE